MADPICDDASVTLPLQLYVVTFSSHYYTTSPGRKKLKEVYTELRQLTEIRHPNLISIFAVKLDLPNSSNPPQLTVLSEQPPALSLLDVLEDCETLREERACVRTDFFCAMSSLTRFTGLCFSNTLCIKRSALRRHRSPR